MKKIAIFLGLLAFAGTAQAAVTVDTAPTSLVTSATSIGAEEELAVFEFALDGDDEETLSSVKLTVNSTTATAGSLEAVRVYKDDGDGDFDADVDEEVGSNTTVNIGSTTTINTSGNNELDGEKFFVVMETDSTWAGDDCVTVTLNTDGLTASADSPNNSAVTTSQICAEDEDGPELVSVVASNKVGGTSAKEAGDKIVLTFDEATNKLTIDESNIDQVLDLNNSHSWLDGNDEIGSATWNSAGTVLTIVLSSDTSLPTVAIGDTVTISGGGIEDANDNDAIGTKTITGSFGTTTNDECDEEEDEDCEEEEFGKTCSAGGIINGRLYKASGSETVYLAAACRLKPFRGAAVFHARGHKFQNIITLSSLSGITVSDKPALPAGGTLVKGSDATVYFVTNSGKKKGFTSETAFKRLGFAFGAVKKISDSDLATMETETAVTENSTHPDGSIIKCGNSSTIFSVKNNTRFPFTNPDAFLNRGHSWDVVATVDCGRFSYLQGNNVE